MDILRKEDEDSQHREAGGAGSRRRRRAPLRSEADLDEWLPAHRCCPEEEQASPGGPSGLGSDPASDGLTRLVRVRCE